MELPIPKEIKKLWDEWNLRSSIILSLMLQAFLVFFASSRQRYRNALLLTLIWAAYLLADWVAAVSIGMISKEQGPAKSCDPAIGLLSQDLSAFWASFLLLHLGGPDTITSFSLEDNEFWVRHFFGLVLQVLAAAYSFLLTLPKNELWIPTLLVLIVGIVKYAERIRALYIASLDRFGSTSLPKADPGPDYEEASTTYSSRLLEVPTQAEMTIMANTSTLRSSKDPDFDFEWTNLDATKELELLRVANRLFQRYKGLIVGFFLTTKDREASRSLFLRADHKSAFRLIEYELSFMFQVLHTKVVVARSKTGYFLRLLSFSSLLGASIHFFLLDKRGFVRFEAVLTYALLIGGILLDLASLGKLMFSDWTLLVLKDPWIEYIPAMILKRARWSKKVSQYNMISYCVDDPPKRLYKLAGYVNASEIIEKLKIMWYSSTYNVSEDLEKYIFEDLKRKSKDADTLRVAVEVSLQRGDLALSLSDFASYIKLKWSIGEFQYVESLLLWHIATEICCRDDKEDQKRKCKILSDYMFYLLIRQPNMMSPILGNWYLVFQDTYAEANKFFDKYSIKTRSNALGKLNSVKAKFRPAAVKGVKSKSVFFDSCILAQQLERLSEDERWKMLDQVWVEFMCYAAVNCRPIVHAQQPSRGGELLTFTWLLMNHLGLGLNFSEDQAGTKMVAVK